jgi:hypothetical protein
MRDVAHSIRCDERSRRGDIVGAKDFTIKILYQLGGIGQFHVGLENELAVGPQITLIEMMPTPETLCFPRQVFQPRSPTKLYKTTYRHFASLPLRLPLLGSIRCRVNVTAAAASDESGGPPDHPSIKQSTCEVRKEGPHRLRAALVSSG